MIPKTNSFLFYSVLSLFAVMGLLPAQAQNNDDPCSLLSFDEVAGWTGINVKNTLPQGNLVILASCTFGGVERPPVLTYALTRGAAAPDAYASNQIWPDATAVTDIGKKATWIPSRRMLAVLFRNDLYVLVRLDDRSAGDPSKHLALSQQIASVLEGRLKN